MQKKVEFKVGDVVQLVKESDKFGWDDMFNYLMYQCAIVKSVNKLNEVVVSFGDGEILALEESCIVKSTNMEYMELTKQDIQYLTKHLSNTLSNLQSDINYYSENIVTLWERCNKDTVEGQRWFKAMNAYKAYKKKLKQEYKKLSEIQHNLKKQR